MRSPLPPPRTVRDQRRRGLAQSLDLLQSGQKHAPGEGGRRKEREEEEREEGRGRRKERRGEEGGRVGGEWEEGRVCGCEVVGGIYLLCRATTTTYI